MNTGTTSDNMICIGEHHELVHLIGIGHVVPPVTGVVIVEKFVISTIHNKFWHDQLVPVGVGVDNIGKFCELGMVKVIGQIEFPVRLEGEGPASVGSKMMFDVWLEVE